MRRAGPVVPDETELLVLTRHDTVKVRNLRARAAYDRRSGRADCVVVVRATRVLHGS